MRTFSSAQKLSILCVEESTPNLLSIVIDFNFNFNIFYEYAMFFCIYHKLY